MLVSGVIKQFAHHSAHSPYCSCPYLGPLALHAVTTPYPKSSACSTT